MILSFFQLKNLLAIPSPGAVVGDAPTPSSNPVSTSLGDRTYGATPGYPIIFPLGPSSGVLSGTTDPTLGGLNFATTLVYGISNTNPSTTALSMFDFNLFRWNVIQSIDIIDQKLRDILDVIEPTCPA